MSVAALGFFDGVHIGHAVLLRAAADYAEKNRLKSFALTFDISPAETVRGGETLICTNEKKEKLISRLGIGSTVFLPFEKIKNLNPREFFESILIDKYKISVLFCGEDYKFGRGASGTADTLRELCRHYNVTLNIVRDVCVDGKKVSSTAIRSMLRSGEINRANILLGREYSVCGVVGENKRLGTAISVPTANIDPTPGIVRLKNGVYKTKTKIKGRVYDSVTNAGVRPTVSGSQTPNLETYIFNFEENIYGHEIIICFIDFIRAERKFNSLEELKAQIEKDIKICKEESKYE